MSILGKESSSKSKWLINIHNPITSGIHLGNPIDGTNWIDFRYEKLPQVCFKCGMLGHAKNVCKNQAFDLQTLATLGPWIRSTQYGKRKMEDKDKKYHSNPSHSKDFGHYSPPVPSDLLEKLAAMRVNKATDKQTSGTSPAQTSQLKLCMNNPSMDSVQITQIGTNMKTQQENYNQDMMDMDTAHETSTVSHSSQIKRQKMIAQQRVGTARQASPQPGKSSLGTVRGLETLGQLEL
jgi:hypothetical protein